MTATLNSLIAAATSAATAAMVVSGASTNPHVSSCPPVPNRFHVDYGPRLVEAVLLATQEAYEARELERFAITKIQATVRMHAQRDRYMRVRSAVRTIQRIYRGHRARVAVQHRVLPLAERQRQKAVFAYYATRIQACYRGHWSRAHLEDFYARKRYVYEVTRQSQRVLAAAQESVMEQEWLVGLRERESDLARYMRATERAHHLLSTATVSGVYRRPDRIRRGRTAVAVTNGSCSDCIGADGGVGSEVGEEVRGEWWDGDVTFNAGTGAGAAATAFAGTRTVFQTDVEDDIRANAAAARGAKLRQTIRANAAHVAPGPKVDVTVGGVQDVDVRQRRQVRRSQYAQTVRDVHQPRESRRYQKPDATASSGETCRLGDTDNRTAEKPVRSFASSVPLPPLRSQGTTRTMDITANIKSRYDDDSSLPSHGVSNTATGVTVAWGNEDALPLVTPPPGSGGNTNAGITHARQGPLAVSSRNKGFRIPAHDCRDHIAMSNDDNAAATRRGEGRGGGGKSNTTTATAPTAAVAGVKTASGTQGTRSMISAGGLTVRDGIVTAVSAAPPSVGEGGAVGPSLVEPPLYDSRPAALQRAVDEKVRRALHGTSAFKV